MKDLTVISNVLLTDGIGRHGIGIIQAIQDNIDLNAYQLPPKDYSGLSAKLMKVFAKPFDGWGKVAFWTFILGLNEGIVPLHKSMTSPLKISYSMFESDAIPDFWVKILNEVYDMVVVPDPWLIPVYQKSGVKIPIFVIPLGIIIENLLQKPLKSSHTGDRFTFGMSASFLERKNHLKVLEAFKNTFGNDLKYQLILHGRFGSFKSKVEFGVRDSGLSNVKLIAKPLSSKDYDQVMDDIDCYVFPTKGEGYSVTPREILALGKPVILSDNTAHRSICETGLVIPLQANIKQPAVYEVFGGKQIGNYFDCSVKDLGRLMKQVADNYQLYLENAHKGREWSRQFTWDNLRPTYLNLFKPKEVTLGNSNLVTSEIWQTSSQTLFKKMKELFP